MPDLTAISGLAGSLKSATEIVKSLVGMRDTAMIQEKVIELNGIILSAQSDALSTQSDQFALLERVRELEAEVARLKGWDTEKKRYELKQWGRGGFVYLLKESEAGSEPVHPICAACYERGVKSVLQSNGHRDVSLHFWECPNCPSKVSASRNALTQPERS